MKDKTLVFGVSLNEDRYSNMAVRKLVAHNTPTVAFGLRSGEVSGIPIDTHLMSYKNIDTISLYLKPSRQKMYYDYLIGLNPRRIIFNPGTENKEFYYMLEQAGIEAVEACTLVLLSTNQY